VTQQHATRQPLTDHDLDLIAVRAAHLNETSGYARLPDDAEILTGTDVPALLTEIHRLRDELAEVKAGQDPRLRCLIVKPDRDKDMYVGWSNTVETPTGVWSRETALEYGFPRSRLDRADTNGSSDLSHGDGHWNDTGFIAEQRGWLRRDRLGDYAIEYLHGDRQAAFDLLEPFEDETEVRR
jgi:hypothetical protein